ncbi:MAG: type II toxin-antitoxin system HicA family toxin [Anaerolineae bacterium]|nr:MAG: type II toxin-antitoxin system HicA family toxin [Anaerolineae bacterium]
MGKIPMLKAGEVWRALQKAGFQVVRQKGSHARLRHPDGRVVTLPIHAGQDVGRGLLRKILRDAEPAPDEFLKLLK